ncbi:hypothetical protein B0H66DRAFT_14909 [Apodospora peruviana]|uniref:DNAJC9 HTH domain-containing protein n=1 Tax=Apodospora peruviana TaxID=516989 RepID=A0AAE0IPY4_9PEZI|nr:hypothetical protein B0H66DRAFT_14909 [Apodospora peruviana]
MRNTAEWVASQSSAPRSSAGRPPTRTAGQNTRSRASHLFEEEQDRITRMIPRRSTLRVARDDDEESLMSINSVPSSSQGDIDASVLGSDIEQPRPTEDTVTHDPDDVQFASTEHTSARRFDEPRSMQSQQYTSQRFIVQPSHNDEVSVSGNNDSDNSGTNNNDSVSNNSSMDAVRLGREIVQPTLLEQSYPPDSDDILTIRPSRSTIPTPEGADNEDDQSKLGRDVRIDTMEDDAHPASREQTYPLGPDLNTRPGESTMRIPRDSDGEDERQMSGRDVDAAVMANVVHSTPRKSTYPPPPLGPPHIQTDGSRSRALYVQHRQDILNNRLHELTAQPSMDDEEYPMSGRDVGVAMMEDLAPPTFTEPTIAPDFDQVYRTTPKVTARVVPAEIMTITRPGQPTMRAPRADNEDYATTNSSVLSSPTSDISGPGVTIQSTSRPGYTYSQGISDVSTPLRQSTIQPSVGDDGESMSGVSSALSSPRSNVSMPGNFAQFASSKRALASPSRTMRNTPLRELRRQRSASVRSEIVVNLGPIPNSSSHTPTHTNKKINRPSPTKLAPEIDNCVSDRFIDLTSADSDDEVFTKHSPNSIDPLSRTKRTAASRASQAWAPLRPSSTTRLVTQPTAKPTTKPRAKPKTPKPPTNVPYEETVQGRKKVKELNNQVPPDLSDINGYTNTAQEREDIIHLYKEYNGSLRGLRNRLSGSRDRNDEKEQERILGILTDAANKGEVELVPYHRAKAAKYAREAVKAAKKEYNEQLMASSSRSRAQNLKRTATKIEEDALQPARNGGIRKKQPTNGVKAPAKAIAKTKR